MSSNYLELWYRAFASTFGIVILTDNPERLKQKLYAARKDSLDPDLESISIIQSPTDPNNEFWLVKKDAPQA